MLPLLAKLEKLERDAKRFTPPASKPPQDAAQSGEVWVEDPLPLPDFASSRDHLSAGGDRSLYPVQESDLLAFLGADPKRLFSGDREFQQAFYLWGKGSGKDYCVSLVQAWVTHILLCLSDPQSFFGFPPDENLDIVVIGAGQEQATSVYFQKFKNLIANWPWLRRKIDALEPDIGSDRWLREGGSYVGKKAVEFPHAIRCWSLPSTPASGEGKNVLFWVLDELAAFSSPVQVGRAKAIHDMVCSSARSRFKNRWLGFAISYPRHIQDYMVEMTRRAECGDAPDIMWRRRATWEVREDLTREDFAAEFARDPEGSEMRYACNPPAAVNAYFQSPERVVLNAVGCPEHLLREYADLLTDASDQAIAELAARGLNPLAETDARGDAILDERGFPKLAPWVKSRPGREYHVHLDPGASGDGFGFALGHLETIETSEGDRQIPVIDLAFRWTGRMFKGFGDIWREAYFDDHLPHTETVLAREVDFKTVRYFAFWLREQRGFDIVSVTTDRWNSLENKQALRMRDFAVGELIIGKRQADEVKSPIYTRQLRYYCNPVFYAECRKLKLYHGDRDLDSHKDVFDAVAGIVWAMAARRENAVAFAEVESPEDFTRRLAEQPQELAIPPDELSEQQRELVEMFLHD